jgi:hypothetical protein
MVVVEDRMNKDERNPLEVAVDRAVQQSEARVNAKAAELRARLREERAKLLSQFLSAQGVTHA